MGRTPRTPPPSMPRSATCANIQPRGGAVLRAASRACFAQLTSRSPYARAPRGTARRRASARRLRRRASGACRPRRASMRCWRGVRSWRAIWGAPSSAGRATCWSWTPAGRCDLAARAAVCLGCALRCSSSQPAGDSLPPSQPHLPAFSPSCARASHPSLPGSPTSPCAGGGQQQGA